MKSIIDAQEANEMFSEMASDLSELFEDEAVTEIYVDAWNNVSYEKEGITHQSDITFENESSFADFCWYIVNKQERNESGRYTLSIPSSGHRFAIRVPTHNNRNFDAYNMTIRLFRASKIDYQKMIELKAFDLDQWRCIYSFVKESKNILISGKTGSGKSTLMRCLLKEIENEIHPRFVFVEDPIELNIDFRHGYVDEINNSIPGDASDAMKHALRNSPHKFVVGEILEPEKARRYIEAIEAGFSGAISTIHAANAKVTTGRLATLAAKGSNINRDDWLYTADTTIDLVVHIDFDKVTGERRVDEIYDVRNKKHLFGGPDQ